MPHIEPDTPVCVGWIKRKRIHHFRDVVGGFGAKDGSLIHPTLVLFFLLWIKI